MDEPIENNASQEKWDRFFFSFRIRLAVVLFACRSSGLTTAYFSCLQVTLERWSMITPLGLELPATRPSGAGAGWVQGLQGKSDDVINSTKPTQVFILGPTRETAQTMCTLVFASAAALVIATRLSLGGINTGVDRQRLKKRRISPSEQLEGCSLRPNLKPSQFLGLSCENKFSEPVNIPKNTEPVSLPTKTPQQRRD